MPEGEGEHFMAMNNMVFDALRHIKHLNRQI